VNVVGGGGCGAAGKPCGVGGGSCLYGGGGGAGWGMKVWGETFGDTFVERFGLRQGGGGGLSGWDYTFGALSVCCRDFSSTSVWGGGVGGAA